MEVVTAGAQDELMQSLDYKLKTSNTSYVTARHNGQYFPSSLSLFSPTTSRVCRIPLTALDEAGGVGVAAASGLVFLTRKAILIDSGSMKDVPLALRQHQLLRPHRGRA